MYRVELKGSISILLIWTSKMFLMYRVELKVYISFQHNVKLSLVPNVPCGVESDFNRFEITWLDVCS